jgi:hypothetical protein
MSNLGLPDNYDSLVRDDNAYSEYFRDDYNKANRFTHRRQLVPECSYLI